MIRSKRLSNGFELFCEPITNAPHVIIHAQVTVNDGKATTLIRIEEGQRWLTLPDSVVLTTAIQAVRLEAAKKLASYKKREAEAIDVLDEDFKEIKRVKVPVKKVARKRRKTAS